MRKSKPNPKRPQLWYQPGHPDEDVWRKDTADLGPRLRLFWPDGRVEWHACYTEMSDGLGAFSFEKSPGKSPCWKSIFEKWTLKKAIRRAKAYDASRRFPPMEFVDNL